MMGSPTGTTKPFRGDIAGLRAIAVIAVVMYHFGVPGFKGGFAGVDIFFVISGFLMTAIISRGIDQGDFSVLAFYLARARRIVPALAVLCAALMVVGWFVLVPADYAGLGKRVASSISFLSNVQYWKDSSAYFTLQSKENWLLHTWSLSVEWQFYIVFPIFMLALRWLCSASVTRVLVVVAALVSLGLSVYISPRWPNVAFYTAPTRAWEMLAGGMVYLFPGGLSSRLRRAVEVGGALMLVASFVILRPTDIWPGYLAVLPVAGTALMLLAANTHSPLTTSRPFLSLGEASYSIYLWHWPIAVYVTYQQIPPSPWVLLAQVALALTLGYLSWYLVERPTRRLGVHGSGVRLAAGYGVAVASVFALGVLLVLARGFEGRASEVVNYAVKEGTDTPLASKCTLFRGLDAPDCILGDPGAKVSVILLGDSHAEFTASSVVAAAGAGQGALLLAYKGCMTIPDVHLRDATAFTQCGAFMRQQIDRLKVQYPGVPVIVTNRFSRYVVGLNETSDNFSGPLAYFDQPGALDAAYKAEFTRRYVAGICELTAHHPVYITAPTPEMGVNVPAVFARAVFRQGIAPAISVSREQYLQRNEFALAAIDAAAKACGAVVLDPTEFLCDGDRCNGVADSVPLYYDDNHLSAAGNSHLVPMYRRIWEQRLSNNW